MKAFVLAAGRGERMRPLTDHCPKPLLKAGGVALIERQLIKLRAAGIDEVVINTAYLGHMIEDYLGSRANLGIKIQYSKEPEPLETGGAIACALPLLGDAPFLLVNSDVWLEIDYAGVIARFFAAQASAQSLAYLLLVNNPDHNSKGDFTLDKRGVVQVCSEDTQSSFTFSGVSIVDPKLVADFPQKRRIFPLREAFYWAIERQTLHAEVCDAYWLDVGTPERLALLNAHLAGSS